MHFTFFVPPIPQNDYAFDAYALDPPSEDDDDPDHPSGEATGGAATAEDGDSATAEDGDSPTAAAGGSATAAAHWARLRTEVLHETTATGAAAKAQPTRQRRRTSLPREEKPSDERGVMADGKKHTKTSGSMVTSVLGGAGANMRDAAVNAPADAKEALQAGHD